jgi:putative transposase
MVNRKDHPFDGACYHIVMRGNNRAFILPDDADKQYFLRVLQRYKSTQPFELFHYCLMGNHVHLLIRLIDGACLSKIMQGITQSYTNYWKRTRTFVGYLWQGPYRRFLIKGAAYLLECGRYIESNPVRAQMVSQPGQYPWSSYNAYARGATDVLVDCNPEYMALHTESSGRQTRYASYVEARRSQEQRLDTALNASVMRTINPWEPENALASTPQLGGDLQ